MKLTTISRQYNSCLHHAHTFSPRIILQLTQAHTHRWKHTVRVILIDDLSGGQGYAGEVHTVTAGYARNYLIPTKKALYATPTNFQRVGFIDPLLLSVTPPSSVYEKDDEHEDQHIKAADFLRYYLRNKVLKIWRNVDTTVATSTSPSNIMLSLTTHPGMVDAKAVQNKLSTQLKIDLDPKEEYLEISPNPVSHDLIDGTTIQGQDMMNQLLVSMFLSKEKEEKEEQINNIIPTDPTTFTNSMEVPKKKQIEIRQLGEYLAKIHLKGNQCVGLRFSILKR